MQPHMCKCENIVFDKVVSASIGLVKIKDNYMAIPGLSLGN